MATQYAPIAKDSSINTTETTPRNIADVLAEELSAIEQAIAGGSGSGGHVIEDTNGTALTQRADLQFVGVYTEDDSANDRTKVNVVRTMTKAQMDALSAAEKVGFIRTSDEADNPYEGSGGVSVTADGAKTWSALLNDLFALIDSTKVTNNTRFVLKANGTTFLCPLVRRLDDDSLFAFSSFVDSNANGYYSHYYELLTTGSKRWVTILTSSISRTDNSATVLGSGAILSVIY